MRCSTNAACSARAPYRDWRDRLVAHFASLGRAGRMRWFVAHDGKRLAGTAAATLSGGDADIFLDRRAWLAGIYVSPEYRRRGVARASDTGRPLYESLGFVPISEMELRLR